MKDTDKVNNLYKDTYNLEQVLENLLYFTSVDRKDRCSLNTIRRAYENDTLGKLIKKMDPIAYNLLIKNYEKLQ